ncbi:MAG TPA: Gfo/Idh/MocA family oxidoreductase [Tepidisphaeraceae bacterium]|jgi:predicted dehydrogenase|nr:Gfo/Idh/MocA family oxidoreductase [Tepidisphaeraceae bacterium]
MIGIGIIGSGGIALANHIPGFALCPDTKVVALCDASREALDRASKQTGITNLHTDYHDLLNRDDVQAVVIATPNYLHAPIALAAIALGKHVLCEKPIAMDYPESLQMLRAAQKANVRHMTAFTYRFVPAMRYMSHLVHSGAVGQPYHFRANRFQDWGNRNLGWRQVKKLCATGEMGDMLSHRFDYGHLLLGPLARLVGYTRRFINERGGQPADVEDWVSVLADFKSGPTGNFESTKLATGRGEGGKSQDYCEINGFEASLVYYLERPLELQIGKKGESGLKTISVPEQFLKVPDSPRDAHAGDPLVTFRYDQDFEFIRAISEKRPCWPSFLDGARVQAVIDSVLTSERTGKWVDVPQPEV